VSYAQHDTRLVTRLLEELAPHLAASRAFDFKRWQDRDVLIGELWRKRILGELERHRIVLLMITPTFLVRPFILEDELPRILLPGKIVLPVLVKPIDLSLQNAQGVENLNIFAHRISGTRRTSYSECNAKQREIFVLELYRAIEARLGRDLTAA